MRASSGKLFIQAAYAMKYIVREMQRGLRRLGGIPAPETCAPNHDENLYASSARADELVKRVDLAKFKWVQDCHVLVCPAGSAPLNIPSIVNGHVPDYKIQEPDGIPRRLPNFPGESVYPDLTISRLTKAVCVPGGVAITKNRRIIAETFTCYWDRRFHHALKKSKDGYRLKETPIAPVCLAGKYLYLDFQHLSHYGHFIADVLPRLWAYYYLRDYLNIQDVKIIISRRPDSFIKEILDLSDIKPNNIIEIDKAVVVDELFVATKAIQLQDYAAPVARQIWNTIGLRAITSKNGPKRVYLSRSRHPQRILLNELEVEAIFSSYGFQIVHPEGLSFREQVNLVANADLVAGPSGSNLFTLAFQQELKSAFIITSPALIHITDSLLQIGRSCELRTYIGKSATEHPSFQEHWVHSPWMIEDIDDLNRAVAEWVRDLAHIDT